VLEERPTRGFSIGMAALLEDLAAEPASPDERAGRGWAGSASDLARAARLKQTLAVRQARAGRLGRACLTVEGVVRIYRGLARHEPARYRPELAIALSCWGLWASRRGQREQAAATLADAVALYRELLARCGRLRAMRRIQLSVGLAVALSNLGLAHFDLGEHRAAAGAAEESVLILRGLRRHNLLYRMLARNDPTAFEHCLAAAVNNLGLVLAGQGQINAACRLAEEAADIYRRLAGMAPVVYESELARALHNLGVVAAEAGRLNAALAATQEAVYLHRCLGMTDPVGHRQYLGQALCAFAMVRVACGRDLTEALAAAEEAVGLHEGLTADHPQAFSGDLHAAYRAVAQVRAALHPGSPSDSPDDDRPRD
jgi:tetratricopeptide (TPR) repeat protein